MIDTSVSSSPRYRAAIIGLGAIAQGYGSPEDASPYCHAGGLLHCDRFKLVAAADPFSAAREGFHAKWGDAFPQTTLLENIEALMERESASMRSPCVCVAHTISR